MNICLNCGVEFIPYKQKPAQKYCSSKCNKLCWDRLNPGRAKAIKARYAATHRKQKNAGSKLYRLNNPEKIKAKNQRYKPIQNVLNCERRKIDPGYKLRCSLRTRLNKALRGQYKSGSAVRDLGCSIEECVAHLESKFQVGWTWRNRGVLWQLDHIIPLVAFDLTNRQQLLKACHYSNLRPLSIKDHSKKTAEDIAAYRGE